jgi:hypothetical protein
VSHREHDERAGSQLLEPDVLLGCQYFDRVRRRAGHGGERQLMIAILEDAVHMYLRHAGASDPERRELFRDAEAWIESRDESGFFSFENVCAVLDLDAAYIRRGLHARKNRASEADFERASGA